ncbi:DJ-1/PfpI family protein [Brevibacterium luteolum]
MRLGRRSRHGSSPTRFRWSRQPTPTRTSTPGPRAGPRSSSSPGCRAERRRADMAADLAGTFTVDGVDADASVGDHDALLLPGGTVNPDQLRVDKDGVSFVRDFVRSGRPVAAICHGPWTLIEAGVAAGRTLTSFPNIRTDLCNAGADVVDQDVVVDKNLITSRSPEDLPAFSEAIVSRLAGTTTKEEEKP